MNYKEEIADSSVAATRPQPAERKEADMICKPRESIWRFIGDCLFIAWAVLRHPFSGVLIDLEQRTFERVN